MKKLVIFLSLILIILLGIQVYQYYNRTVECWWGVMYPSLSFIPLEDEDEEQNMRLSALDTDYVVFTDNNTEIKHKIWILEWFNKFLGHNNDF